MADVDADRIAQVLDNLLDNALSYAGTGANIEIQLTISDQSLLLQVMDTGRGIPASLLPFIFEPFFRADVARSPRDNHSGLGLRIARGLIEAHGGTLQLSSIEEQGTIILITLPT